MIVKSTWRGAGGLDAYLRRTDKNEHVQIRSDLFRGAVDLHAGLRLMEAIARTNPRVKRCFVHVIVSPDHHLTEPELARTLDMVEAEHGLSSVLRAVVTHLKGNRATHVHIVYPAVDSETSRAVRSNGNFERDELISRRLELAFGERITPGPRLEANIAELRRRGLDTEAEKLAAHAPIRHWDGLSRKDRRQADRLDIEVPEWSRRAFALFEQSGRDLSAFAGLLDDAGLRVARDTFSLDGARDEDRATLLVDDATGFATSLVRLLRREAKATGHPLAIKEKDVAAAFSNVPSFDEARDRGLDRTRRRAEREVEAEYRRATTEALVDGDVAALEAFRLRRRKQAEEEQARIQSEIRVTLKARREAIQTLYRERDEARRRRIDRAFRAAGLFATPEMRRVAFALAAAGVLMTGGSLGLAIAGGVVAIGLLPTRARARAMALAAQRARAEDAARRRTETDDAYRQARVAARPVRSGAVRFSFDQVPKSDRVLAGCYADAILRGESLSADAKASGEALGVEVVAGLTRMLERGSPLQVRRVRHWYRGIASDRRGRAVTAALGRHGARSTRSGAMTGQGRTRSNRSGHDIER